jgi:hypothetical protein
MEVTQKELQENPNIEITKWFEAINKEQKIQTNQLNSIHTILTIFLVIVIIGVLFSACSTLGFI